MSYPDKAEVMQAVDEVDHAEYWGGKVKARAALATKLDQLYAALDNDENERDQVIRQQEAHIAKIEAALAHECKARERLAEEHDDLLIESDKTRAALKRMQDSFPYCERHKPQGGVRSGCLECAFISLSAALSRISYLCGTPNEMECSNYDADYDEQAVVKQVEAALQKPPLNARQCEFDGCCYDELMAALAEAQKDAERYRIERDEARALLSFVNSNEYARAVKAYDAAIAASKEKA